MISWAISSFHGLEEKKQILYLLGAVAGGNSSLADRLARRRGLTAALLQAMQEHDVTVAGHRHEGTDIKRASGNPTVQRWSSAGQWSIRE